jgi:hypothetical protein
MNLMGSCGDAETVSIPIARENTDNNDNRGRVFMAGSGIRME